jgi:hypothetical protein
MSSSSRDRNVTEKFPAVASVNPLSGEASVTLKASSVVELTTVPICSESCSGNG